MNELRPILLTLAGLGVIACTTGTTPDGGGDGGNSEPTFTRVQEEIFDVGCNTASCHDDDGPANDLDLTSGSYDRLVGVDSTVSGRKLVVAGDVEASLLYTVVSEGFPDGNIRKMPPGSDLSEDLALDADKLGLLSDWIEAGALDN